MMNDKKAALAQITLGEIDNPSERMHTEELTIPDEGNLA